MIIKADLLQREKRDKLLEKMGERLLRLRDIVDWEWFRPMLEQCAPRSDGRRGGRPHYDVVFLFKVLVWQAMH